MDGDREQNKRAKQEEPTDCFVSMSTMSQRSHLTDSEAWRVVGRLAGSGTVFWRLEVQAEDQEKVVDGQQRPMKIVI
ncbi:hypothetical protein TNCV_3129901 [Trichonephila clavipes]|nr:hypothetical protein TNCV_3129901 [Trichonephila clavipes]